MDKLQAMEVFVQVVDAGGFTRAAENLQLPKATVSTLVRNLESALAVKLLNRTTRQISLTADGAAYYERCQRILAEVRDAEDSLSKTQASPSGRLRIDVPAAMGRHLLMPSLPQFLARYPDIHLEVGCSDRPVDLIEEGVDLAVRGGALADSTLIARRIGLLHFVTCAAPSYIALHGRPQHPNDLQQHDCVNYFSAKTGMFSDWYFAGDGERLQMRVPGRIAVNDANAYLTATLSGMGIAQTAAFVICPYLQSGELELLLEDWTIDPIPLHVVYPQNRHLSAKVRVFVEWISELFADLPALHIRAGRCPLTEEGLAQSVAEQAVQKAAAPAAAVSPAVTG
jgi:LysR family transcriptional regulator, regulator for bpeEF and oprC